MGRHAKNWFSRGIKFRMSDPQHAAEPMLALERGPETPAKPAKPSVWDTPVRSPALLVPVADEDERIVMNHLGNVVGKEDETPVPVAVEAPRGDERVIEVHVVHDHNGARQIPAPISDAPEFEAEPPQTPEREVTTKVEPIEAGKSLFDDIALPSPTVQSEPTTSPILRPALTVRRKPTPLIPTSPDTRGSANAQTWFDETVNRALALRASDLHLSMAGDAYRLTARIRVDGMVEDLGEITGEDARIVLGKFKAATDLTTGESFAPQETLYEIEIGGAKHQLRATLFRTYDAGNALAMRLPLLGPILPLDELSIGQANLGLIQKMLRSSNGMIVIAGPTGAGKTTTAHGALAYVSDTTRNIYSVEDPVERELPGVTQLEVNEMNGAGFSDLLPRLVRADYDTLFLGEVRDAGTAKAGVRQAKAGRQVITTVHSNNNILALLRLIELADDSALSVMESVRGVVSQRLLRRLNPDWDGKNEATRYLGRTPVHEVLITNDELVEAFMEHLPITKIKELAAGSTDSTLENDAARLVEAGLTDTDEVRRVLGDE